MIYHVLFLSFLSNFNTKTHMGRGLCTLLLVACTVYDPTECVLWDTQWPYATEGNHTHVCYTHDLNRTQSTACLRCITVKHQITGERWKWWEMPPCILGKIPCYFLVGLIALSPIPVCIIFTGWGCVWRCLCIYKSHFCAAFHIGLCL